MVEPNSWPPPPPPASTSRTSDLKIPGKASSGKTHAPAAYPKEPSYNAWKKPWKDWKDTDDQWVKDKKATWDQSKQSWTDPVNEKPSTAACSQPATPTTDPQPQQTPQPQHVTLEPSTVIDMGLQHVNKPPLQLSAIEDSLAYLQKWQNDIAYITSCHKTLVLNIQGTDSSGTKCFISPDTSSLVGGSGPTSTNKSHFCWACFKIIDAWNLKTHAESNNHIKRMNALMPQPAITPQQQQDMTAFPPPPLLGGPGASFVKATDHAQQREIPPQRDPSVTSGPTPGEQDIRFAKAALKPSQLTLIPPEAHEEQLQHAQALTKVMQTVSSLANTMEQTAKNFNQFQDTPWRQNRQNQIDKEREELEAMRQREKERAEKDKTKDKRRSPSRRRRSRSRSRRSNKSKNKEKEKDKDKKKDKHKKKKKDKSKSSSSSSSSSTTHRRRDKKAIRKIRDDIASLKTAMNPMQNSVINPQLMQQLMMQHSLVGQFRALTDNTNRQP